jgi:hypothetical protein
MKTNEPIKSNTAGPNLHLQRLLNNFSSMAAHALRHANRHTSSHPRLVLVIRAMQIPIYEYQTLQQLKGDGSPQEVRGQQRPCAQEKPIPLLVPLRSWDVLLSLDCERKDGVEDA